jgi:hypothetical protein
MKGGQSREVGSKESQRPERGGGRTKRGECKERLIRFFFGGAEIFPNQVKVTKSDG